MAEYIDKSALYEKIAQLEELARNRYLDTPSNTPCYSRYMAQLDERTAFKHIIADFPSSDVAPVVHAHWIDTPNYWKCSNCGETYWSMNREFIYCPNCGAKMDEVESE